MDHLSHLRHIFLQDEFHLKKKSKTYGNSWKKRGGVGAFMMLSRKWDRIERMGATGGYDVFDLIQRDYDLNRQGTDDTLIAQIRDLRRYLALVESEMIEKGFVETYRDQDGTVTFKDFETDDTDSVINFDYGVHVDPDGNIIVTKEQRSSPDDEVPEPNALVLTRVQSDPAMMDENKKEYFPTAGQIVYHDEINAYFKIEAVLPNKGKTLIAVSNVYPDQSGNLNDILYDPTDFELFAPYDAPHVRQSIISKVKQK